MEKSKRNQQKRKNKQSKQKSGMETKRKSQQQREGPGAWNKDGKSKFSTQEPVTSPQSVVFGAPLDYSFGQPVYNMNKYLNYCVLDHIRVRPGDANTTTLPVLFKLYHYWAYLTKMRKHGYVSGAYAQTFPDFPDTYKIYKSWWLLLEHIGPYECGDVKYSLQLVSSADVNGDDGCIYHTATGASYAGNSSGNDSIGYWQVQTTQNEENMHTMNTTTYTMTTMISTYSQTINQLISGCGFGLEFGKLPIRAPNASAYVYFNQDLEGCSSDCLDWDPYIALALTNGNVVSTTQRPFSRLKDFYAPSQQYTGVSVSGGDNVLQTMVFLSNRMSEYELSEKYWAKPREMKWFYAGMKVDKPFAICMGQSTVLYNWMCFQTFAEMLKTNPSIATPSIYFCAFWIACGSAILSRIQQSGLFSQSYPQQYFGGRQWRDCRLPANIARAIDEIGPIVIGHTLFIPDIKLSTAINWTYLSVVVSPINSDNIFNVPGWNTALPLTTTQIGQNINSTWVSAMGAGQTWVPAQLAANIQQFLYGMYTGINASYAYVQPSWPACGTARQMARLTISATPSTQAPILNGTNMPTWGFGPPVVQNVSSPFILGGRDVVAAALSGMNIDGISSSMPYILQLENDNNIVNTVVVAIAKAVVNQGSQYVSDLIEQNEKQVNKDKAVSIGSTVIQSVVERLQPGWSRSVDMALARESSALGSVIGSVLEMGKDMLFENSKKLFGSVVGSALGSIKELNYDISSNKGGKERKRIMD